MSLHEPPTRTRGPAAPVVKSHRRAIIEWIIVIVVAVLVSLLIRSYAFQTFFIPSGSMQPTLQIGDRIVVNKLAVELGTINRGDILVFKAPPAVEVKCGDDVSDLVKRVIGLPGDRIWSKGNTIYINSIALKQPWTHVAQVTPPIKSQTVPANHYFMMGDNEPNSCDSRYWGTIPRSSVIGKAFLRIWPLSRLGFL